VNFFWDTAEKQIPATKARVNESFCTMRKLCLNGLIYQKIALELKKMRKGLFKGWAEERKGTTKAI
jgi:hypothetical protein